jgi:hypothetical protein
MSDLVDILDKIITHESQNPEIVQSSHYSFNAETLGFKVLPFVWMRMVFCFDNLSRYLFPNAAVLATSLTRRLFRVKTVCTRGLNLNSKW